MHTTCCVNLATCKVNNCVTSDQALLTTYFAKNLLASVMTFKASTTSFENCVNCGSIAHVSQI